MYALAKHNGALAMILFVLHSGSHALRYTVIAFLIIDFVFLGMYVRVGEEYLIEGKSTWLKGIVFSLSFCKATIDSCDHL